MGINQGININGSHVRRSGSSKPKKKKLKLAYKDYKEYK